MALLAIGLMLGATVGYLLLTRVLAFTRKADHPLVEQRRYLMTGKWTREDV